MLGKKQHFCIAEVYSFTMKEILIFSSATTYLFNTLKCSNVFFPSVIFNIQKRESQLVINDCSHSLHWMPPVMVDGAVIQYINRVIFYSCSCCLMWVKVMVIVLILKLIFHSSAHLRQPC